MRKTIIACVITALAIGGGSATAAKFITSANIKDGTIESRDLSKSLRAQIAKAGKPGANGVNGGNGTNGGKGDTGAKGENGAVGANGAAGSNGTNGAKGDKGDTGDIGPTGATGAVGAKGDTGAQGPQGSSGALPPGFSLTNSSVKLTSDGVYFGPYADAGTAGGSIEYTGVTGKTLADLTALTFRSKYTTSNGDNHATPYLRVFIDNDGDGTTDHSVIYSPNTQNPVDASEGAFHSYDVMAGSVRYDDDAGDGSGQYGLNGTDWATLAGDHGTDVIQAIYLTQGFAGGHDAEAFVSDMGINAKSFHFGQG